MTEGLKEFYELANSIKEGLLTVVRYDYEHEGNEFLVELRDKVESNGKVTRHALVCIKIDDDGKKIPYVMMQRSFNALSPDFEEYEARMLLAKALDQGVEGDAWGLTK